MSIRKGQLHFLEGKKVALLGLGLENEALVRFLLKKKINCPITICDERSRADLGERYTGLKGKSVTWKLGSAAVAHLEGFDILFRSPGWPLFDPALAEARTKGVDITSPMRLFFELCPTPDIVGVTGTKGKGTTAALAAHILKQSGRRVWLGGNIGVPPFSFLDRVSTSDWVVLELSSFQLEDMDKSPHIGVITNFFEEHLKAADPQNRNYHQSLEEYWQAKFNVVRWQKRGDRAVVNRRFGSGLNGADLKSKVIYFDRLDWPSKLPGGHNQENIAAAVAVADTAGVRRSVSRQAVAGFRGLPHRLEKVATVRGVECYNDSFATTPESTITALHAFAKPIILIAGGADKGSNFRQLARQIKKHGKFVVLLEGQATSRLRKELVNQNYPVRAMKKAASMQEAVRLARSQAARGDVVLLSPACASFGMFANYKDRGEQFKQLIRQAKK